MPKQGHEAESYGYTPARKGKRLKDDDNTIEPFLDFGGAEHRKGKLKEADAMPSNDFSDAAVRARRDAEERKRQAEAKKKAAALARAETQAKSERRKAILSTLGELGPPREAGRRFRRSEKVLDQPRGAVDGLWW